MRRTDRVADASTGLVLEVGLVVARVHRGRGDEDGALRRRVNPVMLDQLEPLDEGAFREALVKVGRIIANNLGGSKLGTTSAVASGSL